MEFLMSGTEYYYYFIIIILLLLLLHSLLILFFGHVQRRGYSRETGGPIFQGAMCKYAYAHTKLVLRNRLFFTVYNGLNSLDQ